MSPRTDKLKEKNKQEENKRKERRKREKEFTPIQQALLYAGVPKDQLNCGCKIEDGELVLCRLHKTYLVRKTVSHRYYMNKKKKKTQASANSPNPDDEANIHEDDEEDDDDDSSESSYESSNSQAPSVTSRKHDEEN